jgi:hypothetical protein
MSKFKSVFWDDLENDLKDPEFSAMFYLERERIQMIDKIINQLDELREASAVSKADLARRLMTEPANVRRLFTSKKRNPTANNLADLALAFGYELTLVPMPTAKQKKVSKAFATQSA